MNGALALGSAFGAGVLVIVRALRPRPRPFAKVLADLARPAAPAGTRSRGLPSARDRIAALVVSRLDDARRRDLRVCGSTDAAHAAGLVSTTVAGAAVAPGVALVLRLAGSNPSITVVLTVTVIGALLGAVTADVRLRRRAAARRREFEHALASFLDLVNVVLAGGAGIESALEAAADQGDGWVFGELRDALVRARATRRSPWSVLGELGEACAVDALVELAASVQLAGEQGARIRTSLASRAAALRARQLAELEAESEAASERMGVPSVLLFVGFLLLLGYPALHQITGPETGPGNQPLTEETTTWEP